MIQPRVLFAAAEIYPLAKTGGLADVCASLPQALSQLGVDTRLIIPGYEQALDMAIDKRTVGVLRNVLGFEMVRIIQGRTPDTGLPVTLIDVPRLYGGPGGIYQNPDGTDRRDNHKRFALFAHAVVRVAQGEGGLDWRPDIIHCHDWHAGLIPLLLRGQDRPRTVLTIHNMAFQGLFPFKEFDALGLAPADEVLSGLEFFGKLNFLKGGLQFADWITTVSPTYAKEIQTEEFGCGLDGLMRERAGRLSGILNGIDANIWSPDHDKLLPATYSVDDMAGKQACKRALQQELGLKQNENAPLIIFASRLTGQKMADVLCDCLPDILERDPARQFALLGQGDHEIENCFRALSEKHKDRLSVRIGYSEDSAHRLHAGGDVLIHGSRFEPCGLTQLYALRFGTIPVVRPVGGLADTIVHADKRAISDGTANGFHFEEPSAESMMQGIDEACGYYYRPNIWGGLQKTAMSIDFSWERSAQRYLEVYQRIAPRRFAGMFDEKGIENEPPSPRSATSAELGEQRS